MTTYRTENHWGVTIVREGPEPTELVHHMPYTNTGTVTCCGRTPLELPRTDRMSGDRAAVTCVDEPGAQLVAVVVNGDQALAERICALLNAEAPTDLSDLALRHAATKVRVARPGVEPDTALAVVRALAAMGWRPSPRLLSLPLSAEQPPVGGSGRSGGSGAVSGATHAGVPLEDQQRFRVGSAALFGNNSVIELSCLRCDWNVEIDGDEPFDLAELNQRADEHAEECR